MLGLWETLGREGNGVYWLACAWFGKRNIFSQRTCCPCENLLEVRILNTGITKNRKYKKQKSNQGKRRGVKEQEGKRSIHLYFEDYTPF